MDSSVIDSLAATQDSSVIDSLADTAAPDTGTETHSGAWRIMLLGDSITGSTCYPQDLHYNFTKNGRNIFTYVGNVTVNQGGCSAGAPASVMTEGRGGYKVTYLVDNSHAGANQGTSTSCNRGPPQSPMLS
jgi:hypothetical protein